jgi:hypothetical protein
MEALAALSLAGNIIQFVEFGNTLLSEARGLYKSVTGALSVNEEIELATTDLSELIVRLKGSFFVSQTFGPASLTTAEQQTSFEEICDGAVSVAEELVGRLRNLKVKECKNRKWKSFRQALKSAWTKEEISHLQKRLSGFKDSIEAHILFSIRRVVCSLVFSGPGLIKSCRAKLDEQALQISEQFDHLDRQTQTIISALLQSSTPKPEAEVYGVLHEEFITIAQALTQLVGRLETVNQNGDRLGRDLIIERERGIRLNEDGEKDIVAAIEMLAVSNDEEKKLRASIQAQILNRLQYSMMSNRYEELHEAYPDTFEWVFRTSTSEQRQWSNFSTWLLSQNGQGVYWINGKAGSGKSMLMKHIFDSDETKRYLQIWAQGKPWCIASFFFWSSGTKAQKSQTGLFRSLIFQVLDQHQDLIPLAFSSLWSQMYSDSIGWSPKPAVAPSWSLRQLVSAFTVLLNQTLVPLKLFLLIDGLDEFDGDHEELADLFKSFATSHQVKICLSSRPWIVFQDSFDGCPNLKLQNMTHSDIRHFIDGKLARNKDFRAIGAGNPAAVKALTNEIIHRADGVFLWVRLVVQSLLNGLRNGDEISILQTRLRLLPRELEPLYVQLLGLIEPVYLPWASKAFQIVQAARKSEVTTGSENSRASETRPLDPQNILAQPLTMGRFYAAMNENLIVTSPPLAQSQASKAIFQNTAVQLTARCAGLLEVSCQEHSEEINGDSLVVFIHATSRAFLEKDEHWCPLVTHTGSTTFNPHVALMKAIVLELRVKTHRTGLKPRSTLGVLFHAQNADSDIETHVEQSEILDCLDRHMVHSSGHRHHWGNALVFADDEDASITSFFELAVLFNLTGYVKLKSACQRRTSFSITTSSSLHAMLPPKNRSSRVAVPLPKVEMVTLLLQLGADPNWKYQGQSAWEATLQYFVEAAKPAGGISPDNAHEQRSLANSYAQAMKPLIEHGADLHARIKVPGVYGARISVLEVVVECIKSIPPENAAVIQEQVESRLIPEKLEQYWIEIESARLSQRDG